VPAAAVQAAVIDQTCHRPNTARFIYGARTPSGSRQASRLYAKCPRE
jgi:hypothetical protein